MAFGISTYDLPTLHTYEGALLRWGRIAPWRNKKGEHDERPLSTNRQAKHKTIRKLNDGSIACRLYDTDLVIYRPDGSIQINPYDTRSSRLFVSAIAPCAWRLARIGSRLFYDLVHAGAPVKYIQVVTGKDNTVTFTRASDVVWRIDPSHLVDTTIVKVNRKGTNAVMKRTRFSEFEAWALMRHAINPIEHKRILDRTADSQIEPILAGGPAVWAEAVDDNRIIPYYYMGIHYGLNYIRKYLMDRYSDECYTMETVRELTRSQIRRVESRR
jgi:hypothetical protein